MLAALAGGLPNKAEHSTPKRSGKKSHRHRRRDGALAARLKGDKLPKLPGMQSGVREHDIITPMAGLGKGRKKYDGWNRSCTNDNLIYHRMTPGYTLPKMARGGPLKNIKSMKMKTSRRLKVKRKTGKYLRDALGPETSLPPIKQRPVHKNKKSSWSMGGWKDVAS